MKTMRNLLNLIIAVAMITISSNVFGQDQYGKGTR